MTLHSRRLKLPVALIALVAALVTAPLALAGPAGQGSSPVVIVNTAYLHQRTGPGPEYVVQGMHAGGTFLPVIGRTADRSWWQVESQYGVGWVSNEYVLTRGNFRGVPVVTEFGVLDRPKAIVFGLEIPVYALPNPGSFVLGQAPREAQFPIVGRAYHSGTETWYWLVETEVGLAWLDTEDTAVYGVSTNLRTYTQEEARQLERGTFAPDGIVSPPPPTQIPPVPVAPQLAQAATQAAALQEQATLPSEGAAVEGAAALPPTATPTPLRPPEVYRFHVAGDCYALPLVNFLIQWGPVPATRLVCSNSAAGRDAVILGLADVGIVVNGDCGVATEVPVATLVAGDGSSRSLSFCIPAAPNTTTQTFITWVNSAAGAAAIRLYQGLPNSDIPLYAVPFGG